MVRPPFQGPRIPKLGGWLLAGGGCLARTSYSASVVMMYFSYLRLKGEWGSVYTDITTNLVLHGDKDSQTELMIRRVHLIRRTKEAATQAACAGNTRGQRIPFRIWDDDAYYMFRSHKNCYYSSSEPVR